MEALITYDEYLIDQMSLAINSLGDKQRARLNAAILTGCAFTLGRSLNWETNKNTTWVRDLTNLVRTNCEIVKHELKTMLQDITNNLHAEIKSVCMLASAIHWIGLLVNPYLNMDWTEFEGVIIDYILTSQNRLNVESAICGLQNQPGIEGHSTHWWWTFARLDKQQLRF